MLFAFGAVPNQVAKLKALFSGLTPCFSASVHAMKLLAAMDQPASAALIVSGPSESIISRHSLDAMPSAFEVTIELYISKNAPSRNTGPSESPLPEIGRAHV